MSRLKRFFAFLSFLVIILVGFVFSINNNVEVPLWIGLELAPQQIGIWIILAFSWGGVIGLILGYGLFRRVRVQIRVHQLESRLKKAEQLLSTVHPDKPVHQSKK